MSENQRNGDNSLALERTLLNAMRTQGWILPQTIEDVARAEEMQAQTQLPLPFSLRNPYEVLDRGNTELRRGQYFAVTPNPDIEESLAQAAREGREIPPDVRMQMDLDREKSESEEDE
jgi:hypothetical protein